MCYLRIQKLLEGRNDVVAVISLSLPNSRFWRYKFEFLASKVCAQEQTLTLELGAFSVRGGINAS